MTLIRKLAFLAILAVAFQANQADLEAWGGPNCNTPSQDTGSPDYGDYDVYGDCLAELESFCAGYCWQADGWHLSNINWSPDEEYCYSDCNCECFGLAVCCVE